jgi:hypothetical protein
MHRENSSTGERQDLCGLAPIGCHFRTIVEEPWLKTGLESRAGVELKRRPIKRIVKGSAMEQ